MVPYALYKRTGDRRILADNYEMMQRWYAFLLGRAQQTTEEQQSGEYAKYTVLNGLDYGEWCEPGVTPMQAMANPRKSVGTAYLAYSGRLLAEIAAVLGGRKKPNLTVLPPIRRKGLPCSFHRGRRHAGIYPFCGIEPVCIQ